MYLRCGSFNNPRPVFNMRHFHDPKTPDLFFNNPFFSHLFFQLYARDSNRVSVVVVQQTATCTLQIASAKLNSFCLPLFKNIYCAECLPCTALEKKKNETDTVPKHSTRSSPNTGRINKKKHRKGKYIHFIIENGSLFSITTSRYILVLVTEGSITTTGASLHFQ